jgi:hypothetical protein
MKKQISLDALNEHMFEVIELLKNNSDPNASENEKISTEVAKRVIEAGKVIAQTYKIKADVISALASGGYTKELNSVINSSNLLAIESNNN